MLEAIHPQPVDFSLPNEGPLTPHQQEMQTLATLIDGFTQGDGRFDLDINGVHVVKASHTVEETTLTLSQPGVCIVAQGAKSVALAEEAFTYDQSQMVVYAAEVPIHYKYENATPEYPYLCLVVPFDIKRLSEIIVKVFGDGLPKLSSARAIYLGKSNQKIVQSSIRLLELIQNQDDSDLLVPLVVEEILIRLLRSDAGPLIAQVGLHDSGAHKISRAISWIKEHYAQSISVDDMAKIAGMSTSSFHSHFKALTSMSPLQFQKTYRLHEARNFLYRDAMEVNRASDTVGYASVSQFSREYSRLFGIAPSKDAARFRASD